MRGGPRNGSGRQKSPAARSQQVRMLITEPEYDDLVLLAEQWDIPVATAAYGIFADTMSRMRRVKPQSPANLVLAASAMIAKHEGSLQSTKRPEV